MALSLRPARLDDLERILDVHTACFPDPRSRDARRRNFLQNPLGRLEDLVVAVDGASLLAHAFLFPLETWFGGQRVRTSGIASLGVAPEARRRGIATQLVRDLHAVARSRGEGVAVLYPFQQGFYGRLGYAAATASLRLRLHPASIPLNIELTPRIPGAKDTPALKECWDAQARRQSGMLVRPEAMWEARLADEHRMWIVVDGAEPVEGYVAWTLAQTEPQAEVVLTVREMAARTAAAWRSLWGLLSAQRDQAGAVHVEVAVGDPILAALVDADRARHGGQDVEHVLGEVVGGPMVRVLNVADALASRGYAGEGTIVLEVDDDRLELAVAGGRARVTASNAEPALRTTMRGLSAIAFGAVRVWRAERLGWVQVRDASSLALANSIFRLPPYHSPDPF
jgi:predicted acetyltransferase